MRSIFLPAFLTILAAAAIARAQAQAPAVEPAGKPAADAESASSSAGSALLLRLDGPIGPATSHYITRGIERAREESHAVVILQMDTPGGLDTAMRDIVKAILASPVPVISFVAPNGARGASAGGYILYASHVAAMAPATNMGSMTPVSIGGQEPSPRDRPTPPGVEEPKDGQKEDQKDARDDSGADPPSAVPGTAMERKVVNDAVAYVRGLAELRGRNADWAERAVRDGVNVQASEALKQNIIDVVASDVPDLLAKIDGRAVKLATGEHKLATRNLMVQTLEPDWRTQVLMVLTNPTVAYGLLLIGIYGLLFEGYNPGAVLPGVAGVICLLLALFAFQILPVNYAGLALIAVGVGLVIAEAFVPSFGTLGLGGVIAFVIGSIMLFDTDVPGFGIALPVIGGIATAAALALVGAVWLFNRARLRPVVTGAEQIVGSLGVAETSIDGTGTVRLGGEIWNARASAPIAAGQRVRITKMEGLLLHVEPA